MYFNLVFHKTGPCLWESGGKRKNKEFSQIITNKDGRAKRPIQINNELVEDPENHALLPVNLNNYIVKAERENDALQIQVFKIDEIKDKKAKTTMVHFFNNGKWDREPDMKLYDPIDSALRKMKDRTSFAPYYIME